MLISVKDVQNCIRTLPIQSVIDLDKEVLVHVVPKKFIVDGNKIIENPEGYYSQFLKIECYIITVDVYTETNAGIANLFLLDNAKEGIDKELLLASINHLEFKDKELDIEEENNNISDSDEPSKPKTKRFKPPTIEEVQAYCKERNNNVDAQRFIDFYEAKGWMLGKNKMKDWKAAVRTWERNDTNGQASRDNAENRKYGNYI